MSDTAAKANVLQALVEKKKVELQQQAEQTGQKRGREELPEGSGGDQGLFDNFEDDVGPAVGDFPTNGGGPEDFDDVLGWGDGDRGDGGAGDGAGPVIDEEGEGDLVFREEDNDFIDDEGVADDQRVDFADDGNAPTQAEAEEAEEADDLSRMFEKGRRESTGDQAELARQAENLMAQMEAALDADREAFDHKQPALHKLRMLKKAEDAFAIQRMHDHLLRGGVLGVLKGWLEPMPDGSLPNSKVRTGVLQMLVSLKINTHDEEQRDWLKRSGVGKLVMLLTKLPEETIENQRVAKGLVEAWSRPILGNGGALNEAQQAREAALLAKSRSRSHSKVDEDLDGNPQMRSAVIPKAAELDYTVRPASKVDVSAMTQAGGRGNATKMPKLLKKLAKKKAVK